MRQRIYNRGVGGLTVAAPKYRFVVISFCQAGAKNVQRLAKFVKSNLDLRLNHARPCTGRISVQRSIVDPIRCAGARIRQDDRVLLPRIACAKEKVRLADHALGRGARLTQVQIERGGFWVLAQTQPGGRSLERRLKQHGATRRCEVCKAAGAYQSGELTAPEALARAGWDRSNPVQRSLLLDIFGIPKPPEIPAADAAEAAAAEAAAAEPAEVTAGPPAAAARLKVPVPRAEPRQGRAWPG